MTPTKIRLRFSLLLALIGLALAWTSFAGTATAASLHDRIAQTVSRSSVAGHSYIYVRDLTRNQQVYSRGGTVSVSPASNQKMLTTAAALNVLGPDYRFTTLIRLRGSQSGSTFTGTVFLVGGGDPTLSTPAFARRNLGPAGNLRVLTDALYARGIRKIVGNIVVDDTFLDRRRFVDTWKTSYRYEETTALGALTVNQNYLGNSLSGPASRAPEYRAAEVFRQLLSNLGVRITGSTLRATAPSYAPIVASTKSPPLSQILKFMNKRSDNFTAEILLKDIARIRSGPGYGTTARGRLVAVNQLGRLGLPTDGIIFLDGSGLSGGNRVTPRRLVRLLQIMRAHATFKEPFVGSLAVSGSYGTLQDRLDYSPYRYRVLAKTGTLDRVSALSGYALRLDGRVFSFSVASFKSSPYVNWTAAKALQDSIAAILVS